MSSQLRLSIGHLSTYRVELYTFSPWNFEVPQINFIRIDWRKFLHPIFVLSGPHCFYMNGKKEEICVVRDKSSRADPYLNNKAVV